MTRAPAEARSSSPAGAAVHLLPAPSERVKDRHSYLDLDDPRLLDVLGLAAELKSARSFGTPQPVLRDRTAVLVCSSIAPAVRCAFEVAAAELGAHLSVLENGFTDPRHPAHDLGSAHDLADDRDDDPAGDLGSLAPILTAMFGATVVAGLPHSAVEYLAGQLGVPLCNAASDLWQPAPALAAILTMIELSDDRADGITFCLAGDARTGFARSMISAGLRLGMNVRIAAPRRLWPDAVFLVHAGELARRNGSSLDISEHVGGFAQDDADFVFTAGVLATGRGAERGTEAFDLARRVMVNLVAAAQALLISTMST